MARAARWADIGLQVVTIALLIGLAVVVVLAVTFRFAGASLVWYDEVASVMLAWITYYGAALAALRRRHLGFAGFQTSLGPRARLITFWFGEAVIYAVFATMAWASWYVLRVMAGETLVSLDWVVAPVHPVGRADRLCALRHRARPEHARRPAPAGGGPQRRRRRNRRRDLQGPDGPRFREGWTPR